MIDAETVTAVVPSPVADALHRGDKVDWHTLQMHSVQIWINRNVDFALSEIPGYPGVYAWNLDYDDFLGYMRGALPAGQVKSGVVVII